MNRISDFGSDDEGLIPSGATYQIRLSEEFAFKYFSLHIQLHIQNCPNCPSTIKRAAGKLVLKHLVINQSLYGSMMSVG